MVFILLFLICFWLLCIENHLQLVNIISFPSFFPIQQINHKVNQSPCGIGLKKWHFVYWEIQRVVTVLFLSFVEWAIINNFKSYKKRTKFTVETWNTSKILALAWMQLIWNTNLHNAESFENQEREKEEKKIFKASWSNNRFWPSL